MTRSTIACMMLCAVGVLATPHPRATAAHTNVPAAATRGRVAVAVTPPTVTATPTPAPQRASRTQMARIPTVWQRLAWCESRWRLRATSPSGQHHGLWQIHQGWYHSAKLNWRTATIDQQYRLALHVYHRQGARAWACARQAGLR